MSALVVLGVGLLGGLGSIARVVLDGAVSRRLGGAVPHGTFAVNMSGAFALGLLVGLGPATDTVQLLGVGLIGGFTTFSTWALESHRLAQDGEDTLAAANFLVSLAVGLGAIWLGRELGMAL